MTINTNVGKDFSYYIIQQSKVVASPPKPVTAPVTSFYLSSPYQVWFSSFGGLDSNKKIGSTHNHSHYNVQLATCLWLPLWGIQESQLSRHVGLNSPLLSLVVTSGTIGASSQGDIWSPDLFLKSSSQNMQHPQQWGLIFCFWDATSNWGSSLYCFRNL